MQAIKKKLSSQRGASLTFALLIFLVCAVVGSVVLTAGTAASGRMSQITEMDQRYYSVNSAVKLLVNLIDGKPVTIVETKSKTDGNSSYKYGDNTAVVTESFDSVQKEAAYYYITSVAPEGKESDRKETPTDDNRYLLNLTVGDITELNVTVKEEIKNDGTMVLTVMNDKQNKNTESTKEDGYAMVLTFSPDVKKMEDKQEKQTVTTWKISWNIQNVEISGGNMRVKTS